jgi:hypothetical protein
MTKSFSWRRVGVQLAAVLLVTLAAARPASAQVTYTYVGNGFDTFSCGPDPSGQTTCGTPNQYSSYTTANHLTITFTVENPLPANAVFICPFFHMVITDGIQTIDSDDADTFACDLSTDAAGRITGWDLGMGISSQATWLESQRSIINGTAYPYDYAQHAFDGVNPADLAYNFGPSGTWTVQNTNPGPDVLVQNLITQLSDPALQLKQGQISSLTTKLTNILASINQGLFKQAANQLSAFINQVQAAVANGQMSASTGAILIAAANAILALL